MYKFFKKNFDVLFFVFSTSITCGVVFFGILVALSFMLSEQGMRASAIATILLATLPYSFKFAMAPIVKNLIVKFENSKLNIVKIQMFISQIIIIIGVSSFGVYTKNSSTYIIFVNVLIVALAGSVQDLLGDYIRLNHFSKKTLGMATSVGSIGFRIGMLISGAGILYIANIIGWKYAFFIVCIFILVGVVATIKLPRRKYENIHGEDTNSIKNYALFCVNLFKKHSIIIILLLTLSFKFSDSCIHCLKPIFLQSRGVSKIDFANVSQLFGVVMTFIVGGLAGVVTYRFDIKKCMKISFFLQILAATCFLLLAIYNCSLFTTAILINVSVFFLGFGAIIYRTFISEISNSDINKYAIFLSIGSIGRIISTYSGGMIVDWLSWGALYIICIVSNIPGLLVCFFADKTFDHNNKF